MRPPRCVAVVVVVVNIVDIVRYRVRLTNCVWSRGAGRNLEKDERGAQAVACGNHFATARPPSVTYHLVALRDIAGKRQGVLRLSGLSPPDRAGQTAASQRLLFWKFAM
jgi:hypothetical protein